MQIITYCLWCKKPIQTTPNRVKTGRGKYCSRVCATKAIHTGRPKPKSRENIKLANAKLNELGIRGQANRKPKVAITCEICSSVFHVWPSRVKYNPRYCSRTCQAEAKRRVSGPSHPLWKRIEKTCEVCGRTVWVKPAKAGEFRFCSRQCQGSHTAELMATLDGATAIEQLLMDELDRRNVSYRAQHRIAHWLVDITLPSHRIAIEANGDYWHSSEDQQAKDARKDAWLRAHKWQVFRFSESDIVANPKECIDRVLATIC